MVIDQNGVFYVTGSTDSGAFPVTASAITSTNAANTHGFVSMVDPSQGANGLIYSTYLGGTKNDEGDGIAVANGKIYVTGTTSSDDFRLLRALHSKRPERGDFDAFVVEIDPTQSGAASEVFGHISGRRWRRCRDAPFCRTRLARSTSPARLFRTDFRSPGMPISPAITAAAMASSRC